jgi:hypothetical protein
VSNTSAFLSVEEEGVIRKDVEKTGFFDDLEDGVLDGRNVLRATTQWKRV